MGSWGAPEPDEEAPRPADGVFEAAGGLYMSLSDYARYAAFQLSAYPPRDAPESGPVRRSSLREMHQGQRSTLVAGDPAPVVERTEDGVSLWWTQYGLGWTQVTTCTEQRVQHGGWEPGYFVGITLVPQHRLGIITFATSRGLGPTTVPLLALLRSKGALPAAREPEPSPALVAAHARSFQLLTHWDDAAARALFDPGVRHYPWFRALPGKLAEAARAHGRCELQGKLRVYNALHGAYRAACERGALELDVTLAPTPSAGVVSLTLQEELPPDERMRGQAARVLRAWRGEAELEPGLFASDADAVRLRKALAHAALDHRDCTLAGGSRGDGHASATFSLSCGQTPLELELGVDEAGKLTQLAVHAPLSGLATCR